jgi:hypothetical protein
LAAIALISSPPGQSPGGQANGGGQSTLPAGSSLTATSTLATHGPFLTSSSGKSLKILGQSVAIGFVLAVVVLMGML